MPCNRGRLSSTAVTIGSRVGNTEVETASDRPMMKRIAVVMSAASLLLLGCGGGDMSLTEYVEELSIVVDHARERYDELLATRQGAVLVAEGDQLTDYTPHDLKIAIEQVSEIGREVERAVAAIEPPNQIADLHNFYFDFGEDSYTAAYDALAVRAGTAASWEELSASPEMAAYRAALARDKQLCVDLDAEFEATADREVFADTPWIPNELKEVVEAVIGCSGYPEHPEDVYRPPSTAP